jgi:hypothetical protein
VAQSVGAQVRAAPPQLSGTTTRAVALALALDGVMLPTWEGYKETRVAVIYEPDRQAGRTPAAEASLRKEYFATTGSRESLVRAACVRAATRCGPAGTLSVLGDSAALDWVDLRPLLEGKVAAWVEILDFYHVAERLGKIATVMFPKEAAQAGDWQATMKKELLEIGPWKLLRTLREWEPQEAAAAEVRREQLGYFEGQQERMRYPDYLRRGLPIGSGAVEGACKHVVSDRFKGGGMRWKLPTAEPVLHLRAALLTEPQLDLRRYTAAPVVSPSLDIALWENHTPSHPSSCARSMPGGRPCGFELSGIFRLQFWVRRAGERRWLQSGAQRTQHPIERHRRVDHQKHARRD